MNPLSIAITAYSDIYNRPLDRKKYLSLIQAQTYLVGGKKDKIFSDVFQEMIELIPSCKSLIFDDEGHPIPEMGNIQEKKSQIRDFYFPKTE